jgi:hypothetical protein
LTCQLWQMANIWYRLSMATFNSEQSFSNNNQYN